jgi:two-component system, LytTR family, response regulator
MRVLIVEDEQPAAERMMDLLQQYDASIEIMKVLDSVKDVVSRLQTESRPDLIFMDIQLADGLCFDLFSQVKVETPVVFTTAYEEYAIRAFKVNSVDYLLKPIDFSELKAAIEKYQRLYREETGIPALKDEIIHNVRQMLEKPYKNRFVIKVGEHLRSVHTEDIDYFFSMEKTTNLCTRDGKIYIVDYSLDHLGEMLDPGLFFRVNRQHIIHRNALSDIVVYSKNRLKIKLVTPGLDPLIVSRDKVAGFKSWLDE